MSLESIRCTVNHDSICAVDLIEAAEEIIEWIDGDVTRESIAEACDLPLDACCLTSHVVALIRNRS